MKIIKGFLLAVIAICATALAVLFYLDSPVNPASGYVSFSISKGERTVDISRRLKNENIIRSSLYFAFTARASNQAVRLKTGTFDLSPSMSTRAVLEKLTTTSGRVETFKITIPEGFTARQIAERVESQGLCYASDFMDIVENPSAHGIRSSLVNLDNLEGYLFPETYFLDRNTSCENFAERMVEQFHKTFDEDMVARAKAVGMSPEEAVIMASLIEKEAKKDEERPLISGVLHNRLTANMLLQCDATIQYVLPERKQKLYYKHLEVESPYNTYLYKGLPPGPIGNPGKSSLMAAVSPTATPYYYYVARSDGSHIFSRNNDEHVRAKSQVKREH